MKEAIVLLAPGFEEVEAVTPIDYLRRAGLRVRVLGVGGRQIRGNHEITIEADEAIEDYSGQPDAVILPGGMPGAKHLAENAAVGALVRQVYQAGGLVAAICAAPAVVLGPLGLLGGKRFTCFPGYESQVAEAQFVADPVVVDGTILTSRAAGTSGRFAVAVVRYLCGDQAADELASRTMVS